MENNKKNVLIIGYGSIGQRHSRILRKMSVNVYIYSRRRSDSKFFFRNLKESLIKINYDYVVIANKTSEHFATLRELRKLNYKGVVLVEKPLFHKYISYKEFNFKKIIVAFNLRFYPVIKELKKKVLKEKIFSVNAYAGQHLSQWRPKADYRKSYSASKNDGGGVLLDLSHEVDYLNWILGGFNEVIATGGKFSDLKIDSDDFYQISFKSKMCNLVQLELNYIDKVARRFIIINTNRHTYKADLISNTLEIDKKILRFKFHRNFSYEQQHKCMIQKNYDILCSYEKALENMKILDAVKISNKKKKWVKIK